MGKFLLRNGVSYRIFALLGGVLVGFDQVTQDSILTEAIGTGTSTLKEIDFHNLKQALVFGQNLGGM